MGVWILAQMSAVRDGLAAALVAGALLIFLGMRRRRLQSQARPLPGHGPADTSAEPRPIPHTFVISLARRVAKRKSVLARAADAGMGSSVEVFDAVDGSKLTEQVLAQLGAGYYRGWCMPNSSYRFFARELKWGEIGCALSHAAIWSRIAAFKPGIDEREPLGIVLEDDVDFAPDFAAHVLDVLEQVAALERERHIEPLDMLYLSRKAMQPARDLALESETSSGGNPRVRLVRPSFSYKTTAYVLWRRGARKLLNSGYTKKIIPVDDFFSLLFTEHEVQPGLARPDLDQLYADAPRLNVLAVRPQLCWERRGVSDTENSGFLPAPVDSDKC